MLWFLATAVVARLLELRGLRLEKGALTVAHFEVYRMNTD